MPFVKSVRNFGVILDLRLSMKEHINKACQSFGWALQSFSITQYLTVHVLLVWVALIIPGCVHIYLCFAVGDGPSGACMFHVLILMFILALNCEVL